MVVSKLLVCTQPNHHKTSTALLNPYHRVSLKGNVSKYVSADRGERAEKAGNDRPPLWFYGKSIRASVHSLHGNIPRQRTSAEAAKRRRRQEDAQQRDNKLAQARLAHSCLLFKSHCGAIKALSWKHSRRSAVKVPLSKERHSSEARPLFLTFNPFLPRHHRTVC